MTTRIERNILKLKSEGVSAAEIDCYCVTEKEGENTFPQVWRKPAAGTPPLTTTDALAMTARYKLEIDGHLRDVIEKARA
jgi:hypothetical protein